jgi:oligopeptide/dipeptide ABC transporter ATP-binding protein
VLVVVDMTSTSTPENEVVLDVKDLKTYFRTRYGTVKAVDGLSFTLNRGQTLGIVGESGSGKTVTMLSLMRLIEMPPGEIVGGQIILEGEDILTVSEKQMQKIRGDKIAMILQDPMTSLNPVFTIGNQVGEAITIHQGVGKSDPVEKLLHATGVRKSPQKGKWLNSVLDVLRKVKIPAPENRVRDYPHQMSGGMRQRVVGAIGISCQPSVLIADEPTTSLDATVQAQYLTLLRDLQRDENLAIIFITHDLGIVAKMCDLVAVMYAGKIVEMGTVRDIFNHPSHPYTEALLGSVPKMEEDVERLYSIPGQPPQLHELPGGCSFAPRCRYVMDKCKEDYPTEFVVSDGHSARCWRLE